jgi:outer membrane receptor protein involved in Fe transport
MMKRCLTVVLALLLVLTGAALAANYGKVSGRVVDRETNQPLMGANVLIEGTLLGAATDSQGKFTILQVPPGTYTIRALYMGYQPMRVENVTVRANRIAYADFALNPTVVDVEAVVVTAERPLVEKDNTSTLRSVSGEDIQNLPTTTVNDVLRTQAGVVMSGGVHFRGGRSGEVVYMVDGIPMVDPLYSDISSSEMINRDAISEMQVISGTYGAEYGNAMSGIINISTREGSDRFNARLDIKGSNLGLEEYSNDNNRIVLRGSFSGPLVSEKTGFFLSGTYDDRDSYLPWGYRKQGNVFAKITDRHLKNLKLTMALNYSRGQRKSYSHSWKYIPDQYWWEPRTNSLMAQIGLVHTLSAKMYYELQFYYNAMHYDSGDYDYNDLSPAYQRDENKEFYLQNFVSGYEEDDQQTLGLKGNFLWQANNSNEIKVGFEVRRHRLESFDISSPYYDDHVLDDYIVEPWEASAFIQDKINFSSIILSAGLRFDLTAPNADYWENPYDVLDSTAVLRSSDIHTQFSPRLGISYPVSDKTVFHFGYGHYFQRPEYQFIYASLSGINSVAVYDVDGDGDLDYADNMLMNLRSGNGRFGNPNLKPEKTVQYEFGLSHQLFEDYLLKVSVYSKRITNYVGGRTFFAGDKPEYWETFSVHINEDFGYNNGLEIQLRKLRGRYLSGEVNYAYVVHEGSSSGPLERVGIEEANRQTLKFFPLSYDQRHTVNTYLTLRFGKGEGPALGGVRFLENLRATLLFQYGSGLPYTIGTRGATEPYERNNGRLPENWTLDLKVDRRFDLGSVGITPYLEIYNLTNRRNVVYVDPYTGQPDYSYGRTYEYAANPLNWSQPRMIYLGLIIGN